jgi:type IV pilus assembly protein PilV
MHRLNHSPSINPAPAQRQRGIALIESLIAIVVTALGILGILGVQMRTLSDTSTTVRRAQAIRLIEDLGERMRVSPNAIASAGIFNGSSSITPPTNCNSGCDVSSLAAYDLKIWKDTVANTLPSGQAIVFLPPAETAGQSSQLGVMIAWRQNERHDASSDFKDNIDATKINDGGTFKNQGGSAATCPANHICHLQYIPIAARCSSDENFPGQYFCAGPQKIS